MNREEALRVVLDEIDLWLDMYDKESDVYENLIEALKLLRG